MRVPWRTASTSPPDRYCATCREPLSGVLAEACPACKRPFDPEDPSTTSPDPTAYCTGCAYDLVGVDHSACPECATPFDPADPATYHTRPNELRISRGRVFGYLAFICLGLGLTFLVQHTIIPRPAITNNGRWLWSVWLWLDEPYGVLHTRGAPSGQRLHLRAGTVSEVEADLPDPTSPTGTSPAYRVARTDTGWTLEVFREGVQWQDLLQAFNSTRTYDEVIGVRIRDEAIDLNETPFSVTGNDIEVFQAMIDAYGLVIDPGVTMQRPDRVWVQREDGQLVQVPIEEAHAMGHETPLISGRSITRIPRRLR